MTISAQADKLIHMTLARRDPLYSILIICITAMSVAAFGIILAKGSHDAPIQPSLTWSGSIFVFIWPVLFIFLALSAAMIRVATGSTAIASEALGLYLMQLILALSWCIMALHFYEPRAAIALLAALFLLTLMTMQAFARISRDAAYMQAPWLLWIIAALYLSLSSLVL